MAILIDVILLVIIALFVFIGYKQGLIKAAIKILSFAIAIIVAVALYKPVTDIVIEKTGLDEKVKNTIVEKLTPEGMKKEDAKLTELDVSEINIPKGIVDVANSSIDQIAGTVTIKIMQIVVFIILFIVIKLILQLICVLADLITKLPVIKQFNEVRRNDMWIFKRNNNSICNIGSNIFSKAINWSRIREQYEQYYSNKNII